MTEQRTSNSTQASKTYPKDCADLKVCLLVPTYNNAKTLKRVVSGVLEYCSDVLIVNDGSTDNTKEILKEFEEVATIIHFDENRGKGDALKVGLARAAEMGFRYAVTIDSDGQHLAENIPLFLDALRENPDSLIIGARDLESEGAPKKSSFGNRFSNFWFWIETGKKLPDTQTGFRAYPLKFVKDMKFYTGKFEFEIEILVRLAWKEVKILNVPVRAIYDPEERVSHFRPGPDFFRISVLNTVLVTITLLWQLPLRLFRYVRRQGVWKVIKEDLIDINETTGKKSSAIGFGLFMGIAPLWGVQMLVAAALAVPLKLNKVVVLAFSNISIPPMIPFIIYGSYKMGGLFIANPNKIDHWRDMTLESIYINFSQYLIGSFALALTAGILGFLVSFGILTFIRKNRKNA
jgi:glycosyltransferase involved in cell wall biosynthesis